MRIFITQKRKKEYLINKLKSKEKPDGKKLQPEFPEIFDIDGYELFCYLVDKYKEDNHSLKAKYSFIFHFLKHEQKIICKNETYIDFIKKKYEVKLSRIQPKQNKYEDRIFGLLSRLSHGFKPQNTN